MEMKEKRKHTFRICLIWQCLSINQSPVFPLEHRAFTKYFHRSLFVANFFSSFHVFPSLAISSKIVRFHVFLGLPLALLPWGFQSKVILSTNDFKPKTPLSWNSAGNMKWFSDEWIRPPDDVQYYRQLVAITMVAHWIIKFIRVYLTN